MNHPNLPHNPLEEEAKSIELLGPYWRRAHHDGGFWVTLIVMLITAALFVGFMCLSTPRHVETDHKQSVP